MFGLAPWRGKGNVALRENDPFALMRREFDTLFDRFFGPSVLENWERPGWGLDLEEADKELVIRAEAPGFEAGDFDIRVTGDTLNIVAEHKTEEKKDKEGQRSFTRLERTIMLPPVADTEKVAASYRNGILEVHFPKRPEAAGRKIEVKA